MKSRWHVPRPISEIHDASTSDRGVDRLAGPAARPYSVLCPDMPVLERMREHVGDVHRSIRAFVGVQHLFGSTASLIREIVEGHVDPARVFLLGKPYSANREVVRYLTSREFWVHPSSTEQSLEGENDGEMDHRIITMLSLLRHGLIRGEGETAGRVLLIDDGGRAIRMLHDDRFADIRHRFTCVEQTRCGIRTLENLDLQVPVINVAESWVKLEHESPIIAESVNRELMKKLQAMETTGIAVGRSALVIGYGSIGRAVGRELRECGWRVRIYDTEEQRLATAAHDGFQALRDLHTALHGGGVIVGCTGKPVLGQSDYDHIPHGAILVSASSADVEFRAWQLRPQGTCLGRPEAWFRSGNPESSHCRDNADARIGRDHPCFSLYRIGSPRRAFYLVNGGFPVNFTGGVDPIPPDQIQLTRSLLYLGAVQASRSTRPGLHALNDAHQRALVDAYRQTRNREAA
jgi:S-adenosylhomocysteine hydrolase